MKLLWTKESLSKLQEIETYIAADNPKAANELVNKIIFLAESLIDNPKKGRVVPELQISQIRELIHKNYRLVYLLKRNSVEILTVFEGHRLVKSEEILSNKKSN